MHLPYACVFNGYIIYLCLWASGLHILCNSHVEIAVLVHLDHSYAGLYITIGNIS